jgi:demethylmenaquinone methyltransferase/2-methoxy-6-polyprenyl-1,4-benzoquinol methylase
LTSEPEAVIPQSPQPITHDVVDDSLRAKAPDRIAGMFDAIARRYDLLNRVLSAGLDQHWRRRAVTALRLTGKETLLDLCTGTADVAIMACGRGGAARAVGVDFSQEMLRIGRAKVGKRDARRRIALIRGDAAAIPLQSSSVDAATIAFGIRNVQEPDVACRELARVMRSGGRLAILEFGLPRPAAIRKAYLWYSNRVLPAIGKLVSRHRSAYDYLPESVSRFPAPEAFGQMLQAGGFPHVEIVPLSFGIVYLYVAQR